MLPCLYTYEIKCTIYRKVKTWLIVEPEHSINAKIKAPSNMNIAKVS